MDLLQQLQLKNRIRCVASENGFNHNIQAWTPLEWAGAVTGEAGELANKCKKLRRGDKVELESIAEEVGDVVIYLDLLCQKLGLNLRRCIVDKFNKVSDEIGSQQRLVDKPHIDIDLAVGYLEDGAINTALQILKGERR